MDDPKPQGDILDEIFSRGNAPPSPLSYPPPPPRIDPPDDIPLPPLPRETKKPQLAQRLLPWLCALLGGAVLALVLCGAQLIRMNTRLDDLQAGLEEIQAVDQLREENEALKAENEAIESARKDVEARAELLGQEAIYTGTLLESANLDREKGQMLAWLERFVREKDYLMAAVGIESFNKWYDWNWTTPPVSGQPPLPGQQARYRELRQEVLDHSDYLIAEPNPRATEDNPMLWISLAADRFGPGEWLAATLLWSTLRYSTQQLDTTASNIAHFYGDQELMATLENGAFQPSTRKLLEQLKDDLIRRGNLGETEDGTVFVITCGEDGLTDHATVLVPSE